MAAENEAVTKITDLDQIKCFLDYIKAFKMDRAVAFVRYHSFINDDMVQSCISLTVASVLLLCSSPVGSFLSRKRANNVYYYSNLYVQKQQGILHEPVV